MYARFRDLHELAAKASQDEVQLLNQMNKEGPSDPAKPKRGSTLLDIASLDDEIKGEKDPARAQRLQTRRDQMVNDYKTEFDTAYPSEAERKDYAAKAAAGKAPEGDDANQLLYLREQAKGINTTNTDRRNQMAAAQGDHDRSVASSQKAISDGYVAPEKAVKDNAAADKAKAQGRPDLERL